MNLAKLSKVYRNNIYLDNIFKEKYKNDNKLVEKNGIELLVEIGEFINETKVFKYWTSKLPNKDKMLDEYADVITMILTFYHELNMDIEELNVNTKENDLLVLFKEIYNLALKFLDNYKDLDKLFEIVIHIGNVLEFSEDEIINAIENKQKIIKERLNSDY